MAVWPERPYEVDFFKKSSEFWDPTFPEWSKKDKNWSEMDAIPRFSGIPGPEMMPGGSGTSWKHSGPLKKQLKNKNKGFGGLRGLGGGHPLSGPLFLYDKELRISLCGVGGMGRSREIS